jgi:hypothetical protein
LIVKNVFDILKKKFKELLHKSELSVVGLPNFFTCYCLLHNLLRIEDKASIQRLLCIIELEPNNFCDNHSVFNNNAKDQIHQQVEGEEISR